MEKEQIQEKILRWQLLADGYAKTNSNVFIKDILGNYYFCKIVLVGETRILVDVYAPEQRAGKRENIEWLKIMEFDKVREERKNVSNK